MPGTVLVTDGEQRAALAIVRSLGAAGWRPLVASISGRSLAGASRWAAAEFRSPDPLRDPAAFAGQIGRWIGEQKVDLLIPVAEPALLALLPERARLAARLPFAPIEAFRRVSDKALLTRLAPELGIAVPGQVLLESPAAAAAFDPGSITFPVVLKPGRSVAEGAEGRAKFSVRHVARPEAFRPAVGRLPEAAFPLLVQQRVVGPGVGIFLLLWKGRIAAQFAHRRIREKPPAGGVSVYRESIPADPALVARSRALLERCGMEGVAMVEYKMDAASGTPYLMEINGRFWGSLQLAVDAGVDFPRILADLAMGGEPGAPPEYRSGVRSRWWWGDVDHLLARLRRSDESLSLPPGEPGRLGALARFLALWRPGDRNEILRLSDPRPFWRETVEWLHGR